MSGFINFSELYNSGGTFDLQEVNESGSTSTIYGGYAPSTDPAASTQDKGNWLIRRLVCTETSGKQTIECTWARGAWSNRANLTYQFGKP